MDPSKALDKIRLEIVNYVTSPAWTPVHLIEGIGALDDWMSKGGALPEQWVPEGKVRGRPRRDTDGPVTLEGEIHGKRSTYNKGCRCLECTGANREAGARARAAREKRHANT